MQQVDCLRRSLTFTAEVPKILGDAHKLLRGRRIGTCIGLLPVAPQHAARLSASSGAVPSATQTPSSCFLDSPKIKFDRLCAQKVAPPPRGKTILACSAPAEHLDPCYWVKACSNAHTECPLRRQLVGWDASRCAAPRRGNSKRGAVSKRPPCPHPSPQIFSYSHMLSSCSLVPRLCRL